MTKIVKYTSTSWEKKTIQMMDPPDLEGVEEEDKKRAQQIYDRLESIQIEVRRVNRPTRQGWDRTFARILADDEVLRHESKRTDQGLHLESIEKLEKFNLDVLGKALVKVMGLHVGDLDVQEMKPSAAIEQLAECGLTGYASKACRRCQSPTLSQGES